MFSKVKPNVRSVTLVDILRHSSTKTPINEKKARYNSLRDFIRNRELKLAQLRLKLKVTQLLSRSIPTQTARLCL